MYDNDAVASEVLQLPALMQGLKDPFVARRAAGAMLEFLVWTDDIGAEDARDPATVALVETIMERLVDGSYRQDHQTQKTPLDADKEAMLTEAMRRAAKPRTADKEHSPTPEPVEDRLDRARRSVAGLAATNILGGTLGLNVRSVQESAAAQLRRPAGGGRRVVPGGKRPVIRGQIDG